MFERIDDHCRKILPMRTIQYVYSLFLADLIESSMCFRDLPKPAMYAFGFVVQIIILSIFFTFAIKSFVASTNQSYISLTDSATASCEAVGKPLTGTFTATSDGFWSGSTYYQSNKAMYEFTFSNLQFSAGDPNKEFQKLMINFGKDVVEVIGTKAINQTITTNLLYWMNYQSTITDVNDDIQLFEFTGSPASVFDVKFRW